MPALTLFGVPEDSPRIAEAEQAGWMISTIPGPLDPAEQVAAWRALSRSPGQAVWVHWMGLRSPDFASLRRFRVACADTRIIIEVPEELTPPDDTLAQVVGIGVWDIVRNPRTELSQVLLHPASFAAAAVWQGSVRAFDEPEPATEKIVREIVTVQHETIVEKRVPMTNRSVLIAVWGAVAGTGASTLSASMGRLLTQYGPTVVLDHVPAARHGSWVADGRTGLATLQAELRLPPELTLRPATWEPSSTRDGHHVDVPNWRTATQERAFSYVVVDAGLPVQDAETGDLVRNADLNLLLLPPLTRMQGCWAWVDTQVQRERRVTTAVLGRVHAEAMRRHDPEAQVLGLPWPHEAGHDSALEAWLAAVLPGPAKSSWFSWRRGPRRHWSSIIVKGFTAGGFGLFAMGLGLWAMGRVLALHPALLHQLPTWAQQAEQHWMATGRSLLRFLHRDFP